MQDCNTEVGDIGTHLPTPADMPKIGADSPLSAAIRAQAIRMKAKLDNSVPTNARRAEVRAKGYRGPLTRAELAARAARNSQNT